MSIGVPIVASSTPSVMEVIHDSVTGLLVDFFSPDQVAKAIHEIITCPQDYLSMTKNARELILDKYSIDNCVPRHLSLINLVASRSLI